MSNCRFNGAKDAGEERFDPRFDCQEPAVWHLLLSRDFDPSAADDVAIHALSCEEHVMLVYDHIAMRHRATKLCGAEHVR